MKRVLINSHMRFMKPFYGRELKGMPVNMNEFLL
jgi:hypothetical protein